MLLQKCGRGVQRNWKIWTYASSQEPLQDVGFHVRTAQPGEHTAVRLPPFPLLLWLRGQDSGPLPGTLGEPGSRLLSKKLQTINQGCKKNYKSCARYLGECSLLVKGLSKSTAFAFNCTISLFLPLHQLGTWHFLFEKGTVSKKCGKHLGKQLGLIVETCLSNKASAKWCAALFCFNVFRFVGEECYQLMILRVPGSFVSDTLTFSQMEAIILS